MIQNNKGRQFKPKQTMSKKWLIIPFFATVTATALAEEPCITQSQEQQFQQVLIQHPPIDPAVFNEILKLKNEVKAFCGSNAATESQAKLQAALDNASRMTPHKGEQLFFSDVFSPTLADGLIKRLDTEEKRPKSLVSTGDGARGIAVDLAKSKIYWSDVNRHVIREANLDGKRQKDIVTTGLDFPYDVDIDNEKIYWSDQNKIGRANLDGTNQTFIIPFPCASSVGNFCTAGGGLAIDSANKKLYWTTSYCSDNSCSTPESILGNIVRSDLDGSNIEIVVAAVGRPSSIQVDPIGKKIYWTDYVNDVVRRSNLDGTGIDDLFVVGKNNNPNSLALDLKNGYIYWDQDGDAPNRSCIKRMHLNGNHPENVHCGFGNIPDIEFVDAPPHH